MPVTVYSLSDIYSIINDGFEFNLPQNVLDNINVIANKVGAPNYIKTPTFEKKYKSTSASDSSSTEKKQRKNNRHANQAKAISNDEWNALINKSNKQHNETEKNQLDLCVNNIRLCLNKLTNKNSQDIQQKIVMELANIEYYFEDAALSTEEIFTHKQQISNMIYGILASNKFYSKIYSSVYVNLTQKYRWLRDIFDHRLNEYSLSFDNILSADPEVDYDKFCEVTKINDKKKSESTFIRNLTADTFISEATVVNIIKLMLTKITKYILIEGKNTEVDVLTDNLCILFDAQMISNVEDDASNEEEFQINGKSILDVFNDLATSNIKEFKSLSNKTKFKYMDLLHL